MPKRKNKNIEKYPIADSVKLSESSPASRVCFLIARLARSACDLHAAPGRVGIFFESWLLHRKFLRGIEILHQHAEVRVVIGEFVLLLYFYKPRVY